MRLRLLGDVHGDIRPVIKQYDRSDYDQLIQVGDFGFRDTYSKYLKLFDSEKLRILPGNHDDYDALVEPEYAPYFLGDYGLLDGTDGKVFYVRGAWSIDKAYRREGVSWWKNEELSFRQTYECLDLWEQVGANVEVVLSHDAPINIATFVLGQYPIETTTGKLLYEMWKMHQPKFWFFGHHHKNWAKKYGLTTFRCLNINEATTIEV